MLAERADEYFDLGCDSPYMLMVGNVKKDRQIKFDVEDMLRENSGDMLKVISHPRSDIPAVTHVDYSARIQTVNRQRNPELYHLMKAYEKKTNCAVLVNTSFNVRGEPIVCTLSDAYQCFMRTDMDILVLEHCILYKDEQPEFKENVDWRTKYELD